MNIYRFKYLLGFSAIAGTLLFTACDNVPEDERLIPADRPDVARKVLIQEFTGQRCSNCPEGAAAVMMIKELYPGDVVSINLHPKNTSYTRPIGGLNLTSDIATVLYEYYRPMAFPAAVIDGANPVTTVSTWNTAVYSNLEAPAPAEIELTSDYDASTRLLTVNYKLIFNVEYSGELNMNLWITEDGIVGPQMTNGPRDENYVHNHVARTTLTGDWGTSIGNAFTFDQVVEGSASITLDAAWVADNCEIVGFLQTPSKKVEQVEQIPVVAEE